MLGFTDRLFLWGGVRVSKKSLESVTDTISIKLHLELQPELKQPVVFWYWCSHKVCTMLQLVHPLLRKRYIWVDSWVLFRNNSEWVSTYNVYKWFYIKKNLIIYLTISNIRKVTDIWTDILTSCYMIEYGILWILYMSLSSTPMVKIYSLVLWNIFFHHW